MFLIINSKYWKDEAGAAKERKTFFERERISHN
jgi:hypothetical protein